MKPASIAVRIFNNNNNNNNNNRGAWGRTSLRFSLLREIGRSRPPESGVAPLASASNPAATLLWVADRPDIVIKDHKRKTCKFIDMAGPSDRNTSVKVTEKLSKYKDLEIETSRIWGMRMEMIPVIIGALGAIKKGLETYLGRIPGQISISELQKITLLGTAHILRRVLSS